jgi:hypothetical protein
VITTFNQLNVCQFHEIHCTLFPLLDAIPSSNKQKEQEMTDEETEIMTESNWGSTTIGIWLLIPKRGTLMGLVSF